MRTEGDLFNLPVISKYVIVHPLLRHLPDPLIFFLRRSFLYFPLNGCDKEYFTVFEQLHLLEAMFVGLE